MTLYAKFDGTATGALATLPSMISPYVTGSFNAVLNSTTNAYDWKIGLSAIALTRYESTDFYYAQIDWSYDPTTYAGSQGGSDFQIVLGYNSASGLRDFRQGLQWVDAYKTIQEQALTGGANPTFNYTAGALKLSLGTMSFSSAPSTDILTSYPRTFTIAGIESWNNLYITGSFDNWDATFTAGHLLNKETTANTFSYDFGPVVAGENIEYKIVAHSSKTKSFYDYEGTASDGDASTGNSKLTNIASTDTDAIGVWSFASQPADPSTLLSITISLYLYNESSFTSYGVKGSFDKWAAHSLTKGTSLLSFTYDDVAPGTYQFGFESDNNDANFFAQGGIGSNGSNLSITVSSTATNFAFKGSTADGVTALDLSATYYTLSLQIDGDPSTMVEGDGIAVKGSWAWGAYLSMTKSRKNSKNVYNVVVPYLAPGDYEFGFARMDSNGTQYTSAGWAQNGTSNWKETIVDANLSREYYAGSWGGAPWTIITNP